MHAAQYEPVQSAPVELVDELRRLLALAGADEHAAIDAFDHLVRLRGGDLVRDALIALVPDVATDWPELAPTIAPSRT